MVAMTMSDHPLVMSGRLHISSGDDLQTSAAAAVNKVAADVSRRSRICHIDHGDYDGDDDGVDIVKLGQQSSY